MAGFFSFTCHGDILLSVLLHSVFHVIHLKLMLTFNSSTYLSFLFRNELDQLHLGKLPVNISISTNPAFISISK